MKYLLVLVTLSVLFLYSCDNSITRPIQTEDDINAALGVNYDSIPDNIIYLEKKGIANTGYISLAEDFEEIVPANTVIYLNHCNVQIGTFVTSVAASKKETALIIAKKYVSSGNDLIAMNYRYGGELVHVGIIFY